MKVDWQTNYDNLLPEDFCPGDDDPEGECNCERCRYLRNPPDYDGSECDE